MNEEWKVFKILSHKWQIKHWLSWHFDCLFSFKLSQVPPYDIYAAVWLNCYSNITQTGTITAIRSQAFTKISMHNTHASETTRRIQTDHKHTSLDYSQWKLKINVNSFWDQKQLKFTQVQTIYPTRRRHSQRWTLRRKCKLRAVQDCVSNRTPKKVSIVYQGAV